MNITATSPGAASAEQHGVVEAGISYSQAGLGSAALGRLLPLCEAQFSSSITWVHT